MEPARYTSAAAGTARRSWQHPLVRSIPRPRGLRNAGVQLIDHGHDRGIALGGVEGGAEATLLLLDLRQHTERQLLPVLVDGRVRVAVLGPHVDTNHGLEVPDVHELGDELGRHAAGSERRHLEASLTVHEVHVRVGHLPARQLMLAKRDAGEASLDVVVLPALLAEAHPLGKLALADVETDDMIGGITGAGEVGVGVVRITHGVECKKDEC